MSQELLQICDNCGAFGPQIDHNQGIECSSDGACRKNPPVILPIGLDGGFGTIFPNVNREDWCKAWVPKEIF